MIQRCSECDGVTHEDRASGDTVCTHCGLFERLINQDDTSYLDVDWSRISVTTKSPERYMLDLMRKFKIDETLVRSSRYVTRSSNTGASVTSRMGGSHYLIIVSVALVGVTTLLFLDDY